MITLKNWNKQQPEVVYFVQTDYQGDEFMKKFVRSKMSKEQWDKTVAQPIIFQIIITDSAQSTGHACYNTYTV